MSGQEPDGGSAQGGEAPSDRRARSLRLLVFLASLIAGALGLVATFLTLRWFNGGQLAASGWWSLLWLVAAGAIVAAIDRHLRSYFLAVGGSLVTVLAYIVWYFQFLEPTGFDFLWPVIPLLVLIVAVPAVLLGWLPVHLAIKARDQGSRRAWVPLAGGLVVLVAAGAAFAAYAAAESTGQSEPIIGAPAPFSATVTVTVGTRTVTYTDGYCAPMHGMTIRAGDPLTDGVDLTIPPDGGGEVVAYGAIGGVDWEILENPQSTGNGDTSGTFSGKDAISGTDVTGIFACK